MRISDWSSDVCSSDLQSYLEVVGSDATFEDVAFAVNGDVPRQDLAGDPPTPIPVAPSLVRVDGGSLTVTGTNTLGIATDGALAVEALNGGTLDAVNLVTVSGGTTTLRADNGVIGGDNFTISGGNLQVQGVGSGRIDVEIG